MARRAVLALVAPALVALAGGCAGPEDPAVIDAREQAEWMCTRGPAEERAKFPTKEACVERWFEIKSH